MGRVNTEDAKKMVVQAHIYSEQFNVHGKECDALWMISSTNYKNRVNPIITCPGQIAPLFVCLFTIIKLTLYCNNFFLKQNKTKKQ